jgi:hypothetical protein
LLQYFHLYFFGFLTEKSYKYLMKVYFLRGIETIVWIKNAFRDYYKPKLRRTLKQEPSQSEMDRRFEEIYSQTNSILLVGINEGVGIQFYEIARFTKEEVDGFRDNPEEYLFSSFGGGWFKLNFYEGPTFIVCVNFKPKGKPKWQHLVTKKSDGPIPS